MKKIALFVAAIAVSFSVGGKALADTNTASFADKAGITPDNVLLYPIDKAIDNIKINITFNKDKKAQVLIDVAEERLGESEVMADKGKADLSTQAINDYNDKMSEAQNDVENAIDNTTNNPAQNTATNTTPSTTNSAINSTPGSAAKSDNLSVAEITLENDQAKSIEVLKNIENKLNGNAKETVALVIEMQTRKRDAIEAVIKEKQAIAQDINAVKEAEKALEQAQKSGDAQAIQTAENTLKQAQDALKAENQKLSQAIEDKKEAMKGGVGQLKKQAENNQNNNTANSSGSATSTGNGTTPAATTPATTTQSPANTSTVTNTSGTTANNTAVRNGKTITNNNNDEDNDEDNDESVNEYKGQQMKAEKEKDKKEYKGQQIKANSSSHHNDSKDNEDD